MSRQVFELRDHRLDLRDVGRRVHRRQVSPRPVLRLIELPLQRQHQRQILAHAHVCCGLLRGFLQGFLGARQLSRQRIGEPEVRQNARIVRAHLQRLVIETPGRLVIAKLVRDRPLRRDDGPVRLLRRVGARENLRRLIELARAREPLPIGGEHRHVLWILNRQALQDRQRLRILLEREQRLRVSHRRRLVLGIFFVARAPLLGEAPQFGVARRYRRRRPTALDCPRDVVDRAGAAGKTQRRSEQQEGEPGREEIAFSLALRQDRGLRQQARKGLDHVEVPGRCDRGA